MGVRPAWDVDVGQVWHSPFTQDPFFSSTWQGLLFCARSATQALPLHFLHVGQVPALPVALGLPPQFQPALSTPTPGSERMSAPSSLTVALPMATNVARS